MDLSITVKTNSKCQVAVTDTTSYTTSTGISKNNFTYANTAAVDVLQWNKLQSTEYSSPTYTLHSDIDQDDAILLTASQDGWFTVTHIVLPTSTWFESATEAELGLYSIVYYTDGEYIYKYVDGTTSITTIDEVIEVNTEDTTLSIVTKDYVSICYLKQCYINYCLSIFNNSAFTECWNDNDSDEDAYKRDIVWMAINVIKYLVKCGQLYEAERIIETINGCRGICPSSNSTSKTSGCGCSK